VEISPAPLDDREFVRGCVVHRIPASAGPQQYAVVDAWNNHMRHFLVDAFFTGFNVHDRRTVSGAGVIMEKNNG
jgi:hypothetical protein